MTDNYSHQIINNPVLVLIGPTAIGKTALSFKLAERYNCEIISVDSMQVYRYMNIGTAKPSNDELKRVKHHLINIINPDEQFDATKFVQHAITAIDSITSAGKMPLLTGGTGMYLKALLQGLFDHDAVTEKTVRENLVQQLQNEGNEYLYNQLKSIDPESALRIHPNDSHRLVRALEIFTVTGKPWSQHLREQPQPPVQFNKILQIGLNCDRQLLYERIEERSDIMLRTGLIEEVEGLREMGYNKELSSMQSIGYKHANNYIDGVWDKDETIRLLKRDTRRYAKRQMTWFSKDQSIQWFDRNATDDVLTTTDIWLNDRKTST